MEIKTTLLKRCSLIAIKGRVDSSTAPQLKAEIEEITERGNFKLVFDMKEMDFLSSAGIFVLVNAQKNCKRFNRGKVVLADLPARIKSTLDLAGLIPYFDVFDSPTQAVGSF